MRQPWALGLLLIAGGCASAPKSAVTPERLSLEVPFYPDTSDRAGPASLASVLTYWDQYTEPQTLKRLAATSRLKGTLPVDLLLAAQDRGMQARSFQASIKDVKNELKLGHPVMAYLNLGLRLLPGGQFVVVTGFDDGRGGFFVHTGAQANRFYRYETFMSRWDKTGRWAILVLPAGERTMSDRSLGAL